MNTGCVKRHGSMYSSGAYVRKRCINAQDEYCVLTQRKNYNFTCVCSSMISCLNKTKFAMQVQAYQERTYTVVQGWF